MSAARLAEGFVVEARVLGRVLGLKLLTLDATVEVVPARAERPRPRPAVGHGDDRHRALGSGLADAARLIDEGEGALASARANGGARAPRRFG